MKEIFSYTKLFTILLALFYICGLVACFYEKIIPFSIFIFVALCLLILFLNIGWKKSTILCLIFFVGIIRAKNSLNVPSKLEGIYSNNAIIKGQVISSKDISIENNKLKFYLRADKVNVFGKNYENANLKFLISIDNFDTLNKDISIGDYLELRGKLRHPSPASNPHQFDYQKYLLNNDVRDILYAQSVDKIDNEKEKSTLRDKWYWLLSKFETIREDIIEKHAKNIKSPKLEILGGIVFGNETINPDEKVKEDFKNSGLLHLLAASGLNVALIYGIWWWIASLCRFPYNFSILFGAGFVVLYTLMTGFPPSILRASIMLLFVLFGKIIDRNADSLALIFFVGLLLLLFSPKMLFDVGFQLSFVVTIGLVVCCPVIISKFKKFDEKYKERYKNSTRFQKYLLFLFLPSNIASVVAVPLIAQLFVMPLQMHYFNNFTPFSLLANIAVIPFIGVLSFIGFISSLFALVPFVGDIATSIFDFVANPMLTMLLNVSKFFSSFENSLISTVGLNIYQIFIFWTIIFLLILNLKNNFKNRKYLIPVLCLVLIFSLSFVKLATNKGSLELIMFDVGNADSFLIKTPNNKYIMIDTAKKSYKGVSSAEVIMNKYLKNERINKLEKLIITHFDLDHCAGTIDILNNTKTKETIIPNHKAKSEASFEILEYLKNKKINYSLVTNDKEIYSEKDFLLKTFVSNSKDENESSTVVLMKHKNKNILFMGDVGIVGYKDISKYLPNKIDVLKVGHHGAKGSINKDMIEKLKPDYVLISAGFSKFNHPHYSVIELLNNENVNIISTKNVGFSKMIINEDYKVLYYDNDLKKLKPITFSKNSSLFHQEKYTQDFIKNNLK